MCPSSVPPSSVYMRLKRVFHVKSKNQKKRLKRSDFFYIFEIFIFRIPIPTKSHVNPKAHP